MGLEFDDEHRRWSSCNPVDLFQAPVIKSVPPDKRNLEKQLEIEARTCQWLILWLDCDR